MSTLLGNMISFHSMNRAVSGFIDFVEIPKPTLTQKVEAAAHIVQAALRGTHIAAANIAFLMRLRGVGELTHTVAQVIKYYEKQGIRIHSRRDVHDLVEIIANLTAACGQMSLHDLTFYLGSGCYLANKVVDHSVDGVQELIKHLRPKNEEEERAILECRTWEFLSQGLKIHILDVARREELAMMWELHEQGVASDDLLQFDHIPPALHDHEALVKYICPITKKPIRFPVRLKESPSFYEKQDLEAYITAHPNESVPGDSALQRTLQDIEPAPAIRNYINRSLKGIRDRLASFEAQIADFEAERNRKIEQLSRKIPYNELCDCTEIPEELWEDHFFWDKRCCFTNRPLRFPVKIVIRRSEGVIEERFCDLGFLGSLEEERRRALGFFDNLVASYRERVRISMYENKWCDFNSIMMDLLFKDTSPLMLLRKAPPEMLTESLRCNQKDIERVEICRPLLVVIESRLLQIARKLAVLQRVDLERTEGQYAPPESRRAKVATVARAIFGWLGDNCDTAERNLEYVQRCTIARLNAMDNQIAANLLGLGCSLGFSVWHATSFVQRMLVRGGAILYLPIDRYVLQQDPAGWQEMWRQRIIKNPDGIELQPPARQLKKQDVLIADADDRKEPLAIENGAGPNGEKDRPDRSSAPANQSQQQANKQVMPLKDQGREESWNPLKDCVIL